MQTQLTESVPERRLQAAATWNILPLPPKGGVPLPAQFPLVPPHRQPSRQFAF